MSADRRLETEAARRCWRGFHCSELSLPGPIDAGPFPQLSKYKQFDRSRLKILPLSERAHDLQLQRWMALGDEPDFSHPDLSKIALRIVTARRSGAARMLVMGAHVLRAGVNRHLIDLLERGLIDHIAMNG